MKHLIHPLLLLTLVCPLAGQTAAVTKNPNNNRVKGGLVITMDNVLAVEGTFKTSGNNTVLLHSAAGINFGTVSSSALVTGTNRHALIARSPGPSDGVALVGWSSSGAAALKAKQDTYFTSPAVNVLRDGQFSSSNATNEISANAALLVQAKNFSPMASTQKAIEVRNEDNPRFSVDWDGTARSDTNPLMRWRGSVGVLPINKQDGDMCFLESTGKIYVYADGTWIPLN